MLTKNDEIEAESGATNATSKKRGKSIFVTLGRGVAQAILMVLILFGGLLGMNKLVSQREDPPSRPAFQTAYTVDMVTAKKGKFQPQLLVYGEIQAAQAIELRSLVAGQIVEVNSDLKVGSRIAKGAELFRIDPFMFETELANVEANIAETDAKILENRARMQIEKSKIRSLRDQLGLAESDLKRITSLKSRGTATSKQVEDRTLIVSQRRQALEQAELNLIAEQSRLAQMQAIRQRFDGSRTQAEKNLKDTVLKAPVSGIISAKNAAVGRLISANDMVVSMYDADRLDARFTLTDERFGRIQSDAQGVIGRPVEVIWSVGGEEFRYAAMIDRIGAEIMSNRGGVEVIATLNDNVSGSALRPGAFVEIIVPDKAFEEHFRIPETALYENDTVYAVVEEKLKARTVRVHARDGDFVILTGDIADGDTIMTTRIAEISEGLKVRPPRDQNSGSAQTQ